MRIPALPATDIYEMGDEYVVEIEVPGYERKELTIEVLDHTLTVKGAHDERVREGGEDLPPAGAAHAGVRAPLRAPADDRHRKGHRHLQGRRARAACKKSRGRHAEEDPRRDVIGTGPPLRWREHPRRGGGSNALSRVLPGQAMRDTRDPAPTMCSSAQCLVFPGSRARRCQERRRQREANRHNQIDLGCVQIDSRMRHTWRLAC